MTNPKSTFIVTENLEIKQLAKNALGDLDAFFYQSKVVKKNKGQIIVQTSSEWPQNSRAKPCVGNGFVSTLLHAYNNHLHLIMRPDDVWVAITTAFGLFINADSNAERLRKYFVEFDGKREIVVTGVGSIYSANWTQLVNQIGDQIEKNTVNETRKWLEPGFSTTTERSQFVGQIVMMGVLKKYFDFKVCLMCGLPSVTLEGTLQDWQNIRDRVKKFKTFGEKDLTHWADQLDFVLEKFEQSYQGHVDKDFWNKIVAREGRGSGPRYIAGWANVFMPFLESGEYRLNGCDPRKNEWPSIDTNDVPPAAVECPVKVDDNGREYDTIFYAGHFMSSYNVEEKTIRPALDWALIDVTNQENKDYNPSELPKPAEFTYGA